MPPVAETCARAIGAPEVLTNIDGNQLAGWLESSELALTPIEALGMLIGFICAGVKEPEGQWLEQLLPEGGLGSAGQEAARAGLLALAAEARASFEDPDYGFALPFPNDGQPLIERATALHDWVRGFLYAFGALGPRGPGLSPEGQAILRDLLELTRLDLDALEDGDPQDEDEAALTELTEYLRVAALLLHAECQDAAVSAPSFAPH